MTTYYKFIIDILLKMGDRGISLRNLVVNVYNRSCTFFFSPKYDDVYKYVQQYLLKNSRTPSSLIERMDTRGYYRLNKQSKVAEQLLLDYSQEENQEENRTGV